MISYKKYIFKVIGLVFFLLNSIGLPAPVLYSNLFSIAGIKSYLGKKEWRVLLIFFIITLSYFGIHFSQGVGLKEYIVTFVFMQTMMFTALVAFNYIKANSKEIEGLFSLVSVISFGLFSIAIVLFFTPLKEYLWVFHDFSIQGSVPRYKAFAYEPSFYALLMSPIFIYFFLKTVYVNFKKNVICLILIALPCIMTLSFGFFGIIIISTCFFLVIVLLKHRSIHRAFFYFGIVVLVSGGITLSFDSFLSARVNKVISGEDSSINGRITESYYLADKMAKDKSTTFGIGLGQIKILGEKHIRGYYGYSKEEWPVMSIPNTTAETLAIFGYLGLFLRLSIQLFLFFKFKVYNNYFSLFMFIFIFLYQLMGSYITSTSELIIWIFAILPIFKELDIIPSTKFKLI